MDHQDRQAIEQLFGKIGQVERQSSPPDVQAVEFIRSQISQQPNAPYYMAQTIVVQEQALSAAHGRIQQLEQELASRPAGGGFLSGLFGGGQPRPQPQQPYQPQPTHSVAPHMAPGLGTMGGMAPGMALSQFLAADRKIYVRFIWAYAASRSNCSTSDSC